MFDKGEMNTYKDELMLAQQVERYLNIYLRSWLPVYNQTGAAVVDQPNSITHTAPDGAGRCVTLFGDLLYGCNQRWDTLVRSDDPNTTQAETQTPLESDNEIHNIPEEDTNNAEPISTKQSLGLYLQGVTVSTSDTEFLLRKHEKILCEFKEYLEKVSPLTHSRPFLATPAFQTDQVVACRYLLAIRSMSSIPLINNSTITKSTECIVRYITTLWNTTGVKNTFLSQTLQSIPVFKS